jgi:hypothetical protein
VKSILNKLQKINIIHIVIVFTGILALISNLNISENPDNVKGKNDLTFYEKINPIVSSWIANGTPICTGPVSYYEPQIIPDDSGGAIICWFEGVINQYNISAQRIDSDGNWLWGSDGIIVCNASKGQNYSVMCSDGDGGVIIAWVDRRDDNEDIYAQRINSTGHTQWAENGVPVCNLPEYQGANADLDIDSDGAGGAIIAWKDNRDLGADIYAQRINENGVRKWPTPNGTLVCNASGYQYQPKIISDQDKGAIVVWKDDRKDSDIYAQRIDKNGVPKWENNGTGICNYSGSQIEVEICSDKLGGAIMVWRDGRYEDDIYAQRIDMDGNMLWGDNGTVICNASSMQVFPQICSDDNNGAIIIWRDGRNGNNDIFGQRIDKDGVVQWGANGTEVCIGEGSQDYPEISRDGNGGAFITFKDHRNPGADIYFQHIEADGQLEWSVEGVYITRADGLQDYQKVCNTTDNNAIITWRDPRDNSDIYATIVIGMPDVSNPSDISTYRNETHTIDWDFTGTPTSSDGRFRVFTNNTVGDEYLWQDWSEWTDGSMHSVSINRTLPGIFYYMVEYQEYELYYGGFDTVIVTVNDRIPYTNRPSDITTSINGWDTINWTIMDDYWEGYFRVFANDTNNNQYLWMDWNPWKNNTPIYVPINRVALGVYEYTIEFNTTTGELATDSVLVTISSNGGGGGGGGGGGDDDGLPDDTGGLDIHDILLYIFAGIAIGLGVASLILLLRLRSNTAEFKRSIEELEEKLSSKKGKPTAKKGPKSEDKGMKKISDKEKIEKIDKKRETKNDKIV